MVNSRRGLVRLRIDYGVSNVDIVFPYITFEEYLDVVRDNPRVARTAHERLYDMLISHGTEEYVDNKKKIIHYRFFDDEAHGGRDAIFGLDIPLTDLRPNFRARPRASSTTSFVIVLLFVTSAIVPSIISAIPPFRSRPDCHVERLSFRVRSGRYWLAPGAEFVVMKLYDCAAAGSSIRDTVTLAEI